jgi:hypothetical protein
MSSAEENAYEILGLPQGPAATDNEIKKVRFSFLVSKISLLLPYNYTLSHLHTLIIPNNNNNSYRHIVNLL